MKYICTVCGEIYDEVVEGVKFEDLPEDWVCPVCGVGKDSFEKIEENAKNFEKDKKVDKENKAENKLEKLQEDLKAAIEILNKRKENKNEVED